MIFPESRGLTELARCVCTSHGGVPEAVKDASYC